MTSSRFSPPRAVLVVSQGNAWRRQAGELCLRLDLVPEYVRWEEARVVRRTLAGILAHLTEPYAAAEERLGAWARARAQYLTLVCVEPALGAAACVSRLELLGYRQIHLDIGFDGCVDEMERALKQVVEGALHLVPAIGEALGTRHPDVLEALAEALQGIPEVRTVLAWSESLGHKSRRPLERLFRGQGLPEPHRILSWLLFARLVDHAARCDGFPTRVEMCRRFLYGNPNYLSKRVRQLTGRTLSEVLEGGLDEFLEAMGRRLAGRPDPGRASSGPDTPLFPPG